MTVYLSKNLADRYPHWLAVSHFFHFFPVSECLFVSVFIWLKQKRSCPEGGDATDVTCLCQKSDPRSREKSRETRVLPQIFFMEAKRESIHHSGDKAHRYRGRSSSGSCGSPGSKGESVYPFLVSKKQRGSSSATSTRAAHLRNQEGRCAQFAHFHSSDSGQLISGHQVAPRPSTREEAAHPQTVDNNVNKRISGPSGVKCLARYLLCGLACA